MLSDYLTLGCECSYLIPAEELSQRIILLQITGMLNNQSCSLNEKTCYIFNAKTCYIFNALFTMSFHDISLELVYKILKEVYSLEEKPFSCLYQKWTTNGTAYVVIVLCLMVTIHTVLPKHSVNQIIYCKFCACIYVMKTSCVILI